MSEQAKNFDLVITVFTQPIYPSEVPQMTMEERNEFIRGLLNDSIFSSMHIHQQDKERGDLYKIFLPLAGDYFTELPSDLLKDVGVIWEFMKEKDFKTIPGAKTGIVYPRFSTARLCSKLDWDLACDAIKAVKARTSIISP